MERTKAIEVIRKSWPVSRNELLREALKTLIPELKESEDERIRMFLLDYAIEMIACLESDISLSTYDGIKGHDPDAEAELTQWQKARAYLEKQKEQKPNVEYVYPKFRVGDEIVEVSPNGSCHPVIIKYIGEGNYNCESKDRKRFLSFPIKQENEYRLIEQKPAEWSEEDKVMLNNIIWGIHMKSIKPLDEMDDRSKYEKYEDFLKSLPERFSLQPKVEWSEEDEKMLSDCIEAVSSMSVRSDAKTLRDWLKSLRPPLKDRKMKLKILKYLSTRCSSLEFEEVEDYLNGLRPSWKPSEEQMKALAWYSGNSGVPPTGDKAIKSLYNDLKKL